MMRRFCLACAAEYAFDLSICPACAAPAQGGDFDENLLRALDHPVPDIAAAAARILGIRKPHAALDALLRTSRAAEPERAEAALEALAGYDDQRVELRLREAQSTGTARERAIARAARRHRP